MTKSEQLRKYASSMIGYEDLDEAIEFMWQLANELEEEVGVVITEGAATIENCTFTNKVEDITKPRPRSLVDIPTPRTSADIPVDIVLIATEEDRL
jgi:hypothetical protein